MNQTRLCFVFFIRTLPDLQGCRVVDHDRIAHFQPCPRMPVVNEGWEVGIPDPEHVIIIKDPGGHDCILGGGLIFKACFFLRFQVV